MVNLFDKLENKKELDRWILEYAGFDGSSEKADLSYLMRFWNSNKVLLYHLLDNNIILEKEIKYEKSFSELVTEMRQVLNEDGYEFRTVYKSWVNEWYINNVESISYLTKCRLDRLVDPSPLVSNIYQGDSFKISINNSYIAIQPGSKISKVLGKIATAANLEGWEKFRIAHSRVLNQKKLTGTLCFSIHPLDYFTMSDNEYNWDSCMNWRSSGCYRMGTVEMCNSQYVIVCYLKGDKEMRFYDCFWNSKKWRNLFIISKDIIMGIKGYPYQSSELDTFCIRILKDLAAKNLGWVYEETIREYPFEHYDAEIEFPEDNRECYLSFDTGIMYNDFGNDNIAHFVLNPEAYNIQIFYSGPAICMGCGRIVSDDNIDEASDVLCLNCVSRSYCDECGSAIIGDIFELDGELLCETCYYENRVIDPITEEEHLASRCKDIYLVEDGEDIINQDFDNFRKNHQKLTVYNDSSNFTGYFLNTHNEELMKTSPWYSWPKEITYVLTSDCTQDGLNLFSDYGTIEYWI